MGNMAGVQTTRRDADSRENQSSMQSLPMGSSTSGSGLADFYRIQIEILGLEDNIASLKNQERTSVARFNSILDRSPEHPVYVDTITRYSSVGLEETMDPDSLLADNPMLKMISYENQSLEARKKMISGMSYPMLVS